MTTTTIRCAEVFHDDIVMNVFSATIRTLKTWAQRAHQRRQLVQLTVAQLDDMGISTKDAEVEANKPMWRA